MDNIFELKDKHKIIGEIYVITNTVTNKRYVGQTMSHRKNKGKYRPFGTMGRFKDHISAAINNTKKNQCVYLNNSIRKYGKDKFTVELIKTCKVSELDKLEQLYIKEYNTMYPNGYNLTKGGQTFSEHDINLNAPLNKTKKRGRNFGYKHSEKTKSLMSKRLKDLSKKQNRNLKMKGVMKNHYDKKKIEILSQLELNDDLESHIYPVKKKNTDIIHNYVIRVGKRKLTLRSTDEDLQSKYKRLKNCLEEAKKLKLSRYVGNPQLLT